MGRVNFVGLWDMPLMRSLLGSFPSNMVLFFSFTFLPPFFLAFPFSFPFFRLAFSPSFPPPPPLPACFPTLFHIVDLFPTGICAKLCATFWHLYVFLL